MNTDQRRNFFRMGQLCSNFAVLTMVITLLAGCGDDDDGNGDPGPANGNVRLLEVDAQNDEVTLRNFGGTEVDISGYWFCLQRGYQAFNAVTNNGDDLVLAPDETIVFSITVADAASDVAIYDRGGSFASAEALVDFMQFGASFAGGAGREDVAVAKGAWAAGDFVEGVNVFNYTGDGSTTGVDTWDGEAGVSNVRILSVDPVNDRVTLRNFGSAEEDLSAYFFCNRRNYVGLGTLTLVSGDLSLGANEEVEFSIAIEDGSSDVALYDRGGAFADPTAIVDFMQYRDDVGDAGRVSVAVTANVWTENEFVNGVGPYSYTGDGSTNGADQWSADQAGAANIRLLAVDATNDLVTLKNFGDASMDISGYFFCARRVYDQLSGVTVTSGNLILAPNEELEFNLEINDTSSDVALYNTGGAFANADTIVDFMMYGEDLPDGNTREEVAGAANIWTAGDFVANPGPFNYTGDGDQLGATFWE